MAVGWHRNTEIIVDTQAITTNVYNEIQRIPSNTALFAVVKADGYGHGAIEVAKAAKKGGATGFCVAILDEAIELRNHGIKDPILILGIVDISYIETVVDYDLSVTVATEDWLLQAIDKLQLLKLEHPLKIHIKLDTGMGRLGFTTINDVKKIVSLIEGVSAVELEGIFTHFSTADCKKDTYFLLQNQKFETLLSEVIELPKYVHSENSAATFWHQNTDRNMIRFGIAMYGLNPSGDSLETPYPLKPALSLYSELIQVKKVPKDTIIGYGGTYIAKNDEWIGTVPIGYADGWLRKLQGFYMLVAGQKCEIIGRICMDQCMIRLPREFQNGEKVTLIGKDGEHEITLQMVANHLKTIHYEVLCLLSSRIPRKYR